MDYIVRLYRPGEEAYVADAQRRVYSEEYHWGPSFIDYAVKITLEFAAQAKNEREEMWVADSGGKLIGCIMLCQSDESPDAGQLRLFLVEKEYRRFGIGRALTTALFQKAREAGYKQQILWTASPLPTPSATMRSWASTRWRKWKTTTGAWTARRFSRSKWS